MRVTLAICLLLLLNACNIKTGVADEAPDPLFQQLDATQTGIHFINSVTDSSNFNIFNYRNFYNGAGVAIGDVNNDGMNDVFFTSNQGTNQLYINHGNWKFEDVSVKAGITGIYKWHTGVTMADVNGDGWLDIYVSNSGDIKGNFRENELYINQKDGTFKEEAKAYGLADRGIGTQATFFDYDHDGDLDCFVLNNSFRPIESFGYDRNIRNVRSESGGHRFYRNDNGQFTDVSAQAGIYGSEIGFGLGVTVGDVNNDGWPDMYVSNDFFERDYLYINQQNGTFKETITEATGHTSLASMGSDMADINNDGNLDIFTTDMLPEADDRLKTTTKFEDYDINEAKLKNDFHHQLQTNCLQLNNGDGTFKEIADYAGIEATDWSWGALSFDFNNDGWKDIFVCNGISKELTNQDFLEYFSAADTRNKVITTGFNYKDFLDKMISVPIPNYAFVNQQNLTFKNKAASLGLATPSFSNGAAYGDLDGDGDLDLVVSNVNKPAFVYKNTTSERSKAHYLKLKFRGNAPNHFGIGCRATVYANGMRYVMENNPSRGFESSVALEMVFGLDKATMVDSIIVWWPDMKMQVLTKQKVDTTITVKQSDALMPIWFDKKSDHPLYQNITATNITGKLIHNENNFIDFDVERLMPKMLSTEGPKLAVADVNGDGLEDFFMGGAAGDTAKLFVQARDGKFAQLKQFAFEQDKESEDIGAEFFDADNDGDADLVVASGGNQGDEGSMHLLSRLYLNDGKGNFSRSFKGWPMVAVNASCVRVNDFDGDGFQDIFIGARNIPGTYGKKPSSILLKNNGKGNFTNVTANMAPELQQIGMVTDAQWVNLDGKAIKSLVIVGDWMPVTIFNYTDGKLKKHKEMAGSSGWWNCLTVADLNGDGKPDLLAGNNGLNSKIRADKLHPARLFVNDFDNNGRIECVPAYYKSDGRSYPFNLKGDIVAQMPSMKKKFLLYTNYAGKTMEEVFTKEQLSASTQLTVEQTQSCIFLNSGAGDFTMQPLPVQAQLTCIYSILINDLNGDGTLDIFLGGNFYGLKPEVGRYDASEGISLLSDGKGNYNYLANAATGLTVKGEVRDIQTINVNGKQIIIIARNNEPLQLFGKN